MPSTYDINVKIKSLTNFDPGPTTILSISSDALIVPSTTLEGRFYLLMLCINIRTRFVTRSLTNRRGDNWPSLDKSFMVFLLISFSRETCMPM